MNAKRNLKSLNTHQLKGVQKLYGYVRVVGAILRLKLLHIIESRMVLLVSFLEQFSYIV